MQKKHEKLFCIMVTLGHVSQNLSKMWISMAFQMGRPTPPAIKTEMLSSAYHQLRSMASRCSVSILMRAPKVDWFLDILKRGFVLPARNANAARKMGESCIKLWTTL